MSTDVGGHRHARGDPRPSSPRSSATSCTRRRPPTRWSPTSPTPWRSIPVTGSRSWASRSATIDSDRTGRRQDEGHLPLRQQVQGARQRDRVDPEPEPGGVARDPAVPALHRWSGAGRQRRHSRWSAPRCRSSGTTSAIRSPKLLTELGPTPEQPKGPFGDAPRSRFANGLEGKGEQINTTFRALSDAVTALNEGRGDFFGVIKSLALFVNALHQSDQQFVALNTNLATFTNSFTNSDQEVANAVQDIDSSADDRAQVRRRERLGAHHGHQQPRRRHQRS